HCIVPGGGGVFGPFQTVDDPLQCGLPALPIMTMTCPLTCERKWCYRESRKSLERKNPLPPQRKGDFCELTLCERWHPLATALNPVERLYPFMSEGTKD
ncbi:hypothetical protein AVEN_82708-1, partial [Araneus ventricosus]